MKVLLVATVQSHICQFHRPLAEMLHEHGCQVHAAARNNLAEKNGLQLDFVDRVFDIPFSRSPFSPGNLRAFWMLRRLLEQGGYDVVHCNTPVGGVYGRLAASACRRKGTRVFYTAHGFHFYKGAPKRNWVLWYPAEWLMSFFTDVLLTITGEDCALAKRRFRTRVHRIHGVGANSRKYRRLSDRECAALREELGFAQDERLLLCTGELLPNKNQITAIRAMKGILCGEKKAKLLLAGNGPELPKLIQETEALGMQPNVVFLGYRTDLEKYANIADLIVSCSYREGLPMNIVEGMLLAKPVVASDNRGHRELVEEGRTGYLLSPSDSEAFAATILSLLADPSQMERLGAAGFEKAQQYTDTNVKEELRRIYGLWQREGL